MKTWLVRVPGSTRALHLGGVLVIAVGCSKSPTVPSLACTTTYGGEAHTSEVAVSEEPYKVMATSVADRFEFKPVLSQDAAGTWLLSVYTFDLGARRLIHQLKLTLPSAAGEPDQGRYGVTGRQFVYEHNGRELQYWCGFRRE